MQFYQHVYGRVSRGYKGKSPGYQLAALSDEIDKEKALIESLNYFSFNNKPGGKEEMTRYSFYRPEKKYLGFGASNYSKDLSGSIGSFAHNYICKEEEFFANTVSPVDILKSLSFILNEQELPSNRSLPVQRLDLKEKFQVSGIWRPFAIQLMDVYLGKSPLRVPMVIVPENDMWDILAELFSLLPCFEASLLNFSTLFIDSNNFLDGFRLVFVPSQNELPSQTNLYQIIVPNETSIQLPKPTPLASFWKKDQDDAMDVINFINMVRHMPDKINETYQNISHFLAKGKMFRDCIEFLRVSGVIEIILSKPDYIVAFWQSGRPVEYNNISKILWKSPQKYLSSVLLAISQLNQMNIREEMLMDFTNRLISNQISIHLMDTLRETNNLQVFYDVAIRKLEINSLSNLAIKLNELTYYKKEIHCDIADKTVDYLQSDNKLKWEEYGSWLKNESKNECKDALNSYLKAVSDLVIWRKHSGYFRLDRYPLLQKIHYEKLLETTWSIGNRHNTSLSDLIEKIYHHNFKRKYFQFILEKLNEYDLNDQKQILEILALDKIDTVTIDPGSDYEGMVIDAVKKTNEPSKLSKLLRKKLIKEKYPNQLIINKLKLIQDETNWLKSLWRK